MKIFNPALISYALLATAGAALFASTSARRASLRMYQQQSARDPASVMKSTPSPLHPTPSDKNGYSPVAHDQNTAHRATTLRSIPWGQHRVRNGDLAYQNDTWNSTVLSNSARPETRERSPRPTLGLFFGTAHIGDTHRLELHCDQIHAEKQEPQSIQDTTQLALDTRPESMGRSHERVRVLVCSLLASLGASVLAAPIATLLHKLGIDGF